MEIEIRIHRVGHHQLHIDMCFIYITEQTRECVHTSKLMTVINSRSSLLIRDGVNSLYNCANSPLLSGVSSQTFCASTTAIRNTSHPKQKAERDTKNMDMYMRTYTTSNCRESIGVRLWYTQ